MSDAMLFTEAADAEVMPAESEPGVPMVQPDTALTSNSFIEMVLSSPNLAGDRVHLLKELIAMKNAEADRSARIEFEKNFALMRRELPNIKKSKEVKLTNGKHMYNYAPLDEIQKQCDPILQRHGFSYSWREEAIEGGKRVWFDLFGYGHTKSNFFDAPLLASKSNSNGEYVNSVQAARMTSSYAKRNSMVDGLGLIVEDEDNDARIELDAEAMSDIDKIRNAKTTAELMDNYQVLYKKYESDRGKMTLIVGEYNLAKQAFIKGAPK